MASKKLITELAGKPSIPIDYRTAMKEYGGQVAAIVDRMAQGKSETARQFSREPQKIRWSILWVRAELPRENLRDYDAILAWYTTNSQIYLKALAGNTVGVGGGKASEFEPLHIVPASVLTLFEQHARFLSSGREPDVSPHDDDTDMDIISATPGSPLTCLLRWLEDHPTHDKRLSSAAISLLEALISPAGQQRTNPRGDRTQ